MPGGKKVPKDGIAVGLRKGFPVTARQLPRKRVWKKGKASDHLRLVRQVVREVAGYAPYEKRIAELLRNELEKRALRFAKKRLGSQKRGKAKREEMATVVRAQKAKK